MELFKKFFVRGNKRYVMADKLIKKTCFLNKEV